MEKERAVRRILLELNGFALKDRVEVLANVFLELGISTMQQEGFVAPQNLSGATIAKTILDYVDQEGETLGSALAQQGLTLMVWLQTDTKET